MVVLEWIKSFITPELVHKVIVVIITFSLAYFLYRMSRKYTRTVLAKKPHFKNYMLVEKVLKYTFNTIMVLYILSLFGINLSTVLGAAGIAGAAIAFAAQTSFSNIISGFFVLGEQSLKVGDFITVGDVSGTVDTVDLLSVKILTPDNQMVRVPNETIIKSNLINTTYFPSRRFSMRLGVSYSCDLDQVEAALKSVAANCDLVLTEPAPVVIFDKFADSGIEVVFGVWFKKEHFLAVKNAMYKGIHKTFKNEDIRILHPRLEVQMADFNSEAV